MARKYGNIFTAIWRDPDFIALPALIQRAYILLITQPDISSCGVLPFMPSRWAKYAPDTDTDSLSDSLSVLHSNAYAIADTHTGELLVRSFIRYDGGYNNTRKRLPAILSSVEGVLSEPLRQVIVHELNRLGVDHSFTEMPIDTLSDSLLDRLWHSPRIQVVRKVSSLKPETGNLKPESGSTSTADAPDDYPEDFLEFWAAYPRHDGKRKAATKYRAALKRGKHAEIVSAAERYRDDPNRKPEFTAMATTWLERDGWNDGPIPGPAALAAVPDRPKIRDAEAWGF